MTCSNYVFVVYEYTFAEPLQMRSSDVNIEVSLTSGVSATIDFRVSICSIKSIVDSEFMLHECQ